MKSALKLELAEARVMSLAALAKAKEIGVTETVCITDEGGFPLVLERMDGARVTGPQIAWNKAFTAALKDGSYAQISQKWFKEDIRCPE